MTGANWPADSDVTLVMFSNPTTLGVARSSAAGSIDATFAIPSDKEPGAHRIEGRSDLDGVGASAQVAFTLPAKGVVAIPAIPASPVETTPQGELALTGGTVSTLLIAGFALTLCGWVLMRKPKRFSNFK